MAALLLHAIDISAGFMLFSRYGWRRALLYGGGRKCDVGQCVNDHGAHPVTPGERRRLLSFAQIQISYRE
jgi:hypothetical protein